MGLNLIGTFNYDFLGNNPFYINHIRTETMGGLKGDLKSKGSSILYPRIYFPFLHFARFHDSL